MVTWTTFVAGRVGLWCVDAAGMGIIAATGNVGGVLTLSSSGATATLAEWQTALRAVDRKSVVEGKRAESGWGGNVVNDGELNSSAVTSTINRTEQKDAPALAHGDRL